MRCPKCGYVSFDYNLVCPKCNKDLSVEQEKLNIPALKPNPPSLLGALLGEAGEPGMHMSGAAETPEIQEPEVSLEVAGAQAEQIGGTESQEIELGLELEGDKEETPDDLEGILDEPVEGLEAETETTELSGIDFDEAEVFPPKEAKQEQGSEGISFELEDITLDSKELDEKSPGPAPEAEKLETDLSDFSLEDAGVTLESEEASSGPQEGVQAIDLDSLTLEEDRGPQTEEHDEITLNLEDLKVNETGQLEIGKNLQSMLKAGAPAKANEITLESEGPAGGANDVEKEEDLSLLLSDDAVEIPVEPPDPEQHIDLDNLDLDLDLDGTEHK